MKIRSLCISLAIVVAAMGTAGAQPESGGKPPGEGPADPYAQPAGPPEPPSPDGEPATPPDEAPLPVEPEPEPPSLGPPIVHPPLRTPRVFNAPTARILPGAVFYATNGIDTSGGFSSDLRVGLGDVAEFGVALVDQIRSRQPGSEERDRVYPYFLAEFRMGVSEHRLFRHQPAIAVGFRKSFERKDDGFDSRVAALYVVGSKSLFGDKLALHGGAVFWDAQLKAPSGATAFLHDSDLDRQLRGFGGIEIQALDDAHIMAEWTYWPELEYSPTPDDGNIDLVAQLAWGVRYRLARSVMLEAGVRVDDITDANLIDAQIFGQLTFASYRVRDWLQGIR